MRTTSGTTFPGSYRGCLVFVASYIGCSIPVSGQAKCGSVPQRLVYSAGRMKDLGVLVRSRLESHFPRIDPFKEAGWRPLDVQTVIF